MLHDDVLATFPNIKLSYENITHKKVYNADLVMVIPQGIKCFAWFTIYNDQNVCVLIELASNKQIANIRFVNACFHTELSYGTIIYGTSFYSPAFFTIEDIFYYKGDDVSRRNWGDKLVLFQKILDTEIAQKSYNKSFVVFGLPVMSNNYEDLLLKTKSLRYNIDSIQFRIYNRVNNFQFMPFLVTHRSNQTPRNIAQPHIYRPIHSSTNNTMNNPNFINVQPAKVIQPTNIQPLKNNTRRREVVFTIKPDIQNDIYHLYCSDGKEFGITCIPDYTTSVMMNNLFRSIKENKNLDALEESDDEEEFQNDKVDRFVFMDKAYKMVCAFHTKFKKWYPVRLADETEKLVDRSNLYIHK
jgi:hypothetical protein